MIDWTFLRNVQSVIEKPYVYILARCPSDDHQFLYIQEIFDNILELDPKITHNEISIIDPMRIFKEHNPAAQSENRQQKNGDYFC